MMSSARILKAKVAPPRMPTEHLILVGGPSNAINGYFYVDKGSGQTVAQTPPHDLADVDRYLHRAPASAEHPQPKVHDLFWANFSFPVARLFDLRIAKPTPGDLITVMIYMPAIFKRQEIDWEVSPWNTELWRNSPWVRGKAPYDRSPFGGTEHHEKSPGSRKAPAPAVVVSEGRIDHEIMMRTRSDTPDDWGRGIYKIPHRINHYTDILRDLPRRIVHGPSLLGRPVLPGVLVKLCFLRKPSEFLDYLASGEWHGTQLLHRLDRLDAEEPGGSEQTARQIESWPTASYDFHAVNAPKYAEPLWQSMPKVDRERIKVGRLDYFGHSCADSFFLGYGLSNRKGEVATADCEITKDDILDAIHGKDVFSTSAIAQLWGCYLGAEMAPALAASTISLVRACEEATTFDHILDPSSDGLPIPAKGNWKIFP